MYVLLVYLISAISWGAVLLNLIRAIYVATKYSKEKPALLIPLTVASLALFMESIYFGIASFFYVDGQNQMFLIMIEEDKWFLIKVLIAVSGVLMLLNMNTKHKK